MPVEFEEYRETQAESGGLSIDPDSNAIKVLTFVKKSLTEVLASCYSLVT